MKKYFFTIVISLCSLFMYAQQGFVAVGGETVNANGSVSFSVGQLDYNFYGSSHLIIEGLQQPYEVSGPLPVSLLYFKAIATKENTVLVSWSTTSENNNDYFNIERSKDGNNFEKVSTILSAGNSTTKQDYAFADAQPYQGVSYYRLKQTDKDGSFTFSEIEKVNITGAKYITTASPNPTKDIVQIKIFGEINKKLNYLVVDINGKVLMKSNISNSVTPINLSNLAQGMYILKIFDEEIIVQSFKIIKQ